MKRILTIFLIVMFLGGATIPTKGPSLDTPDTDSQFSESSILTRLLKFQFQNEEERSVQVRSNRGDCMGVIISWKSVLTLSSCKGDGLTVNGKPAGIKKEGNHLLLLSAETRMIGSVDLAEQTELPIPAFWVSKEERSSTRIVYRGRMEFHTITPSDFRKAGMGLYTERGELLGIRSDFGGFNGISTATAIRAVRIREFLYEK